MLSEQDVLASPAPRGPLDALKGLVVRALHQVCSLAPVRPESLLRPGPPAPLHVDDESDGTQIRRSLVPDAGLGLFALRRFETNDLLCEYSGDLMTFWQQQRTPDWTYVAAAGPDRFVDAGPYPFVKARYINHHFEPDRINAQYVDAPDHRVFVHATRPILPGEEIYADYGPRYWNRVRWSALIVAGRSRVKLADVERA
jgi:hypothetical protein